MYTINYISDMISKSRFQEILIKMLRVLNLFLQMSIIGIILLSLYFNVKIKEYDEKIVLLQADIDIKRADNKVDAFEKEWSKYYFQLSAVKEHLVNNTNYGLILKEFVNLLPEDDTMTIVNISTDTLTAKLYLPTEKRLALESPFDYKNALQKAFKKSVYFDKSGIGVDSTTDEDVDQSIVSLIKVKMPVYSRK